MRRVRFLKFVAIGKFDLQCAQNRSLPNASALLIRLSVWHVTRIRVTLAPSLRAKLVTASKTKKSLFHLKRMMVQNGGSISV